jgi:hypothetical protein
MADVAKAVDFKFVGSTLVVTIDSNKDGEALLTLNVNLAEIPDEVLSLLSKKPA